MKSSLFKILKKLPKKYKIIGFYFLFILVLDVFLNKTFNEVIFGNSIDATHINYEDKYFHHNYIPNSVFITHPSKEDSFSPTENVINSFGIRGPELTKKNNYRVLMIGDSFIQADEVNFNKTFGERLNNHFNGEIEFISHGMSSWSPTPIFSWIYHKGSLLGLNEINLFLCVNDFYRKKVYDSTDQKYRDQAIYNSINIPVEYKTDENKIEKLIKKSAILTIFYRVFKKISVSSDSEKHSIPNEIILLSKSSDEWPHELKENVNETLAVIKEINAFLKNKDITLNILMVPLGFSWKEETVPGKTHQLYNWRSDFTVSQDGIESYIKRFVSNNSDINFINLRNHFEKRKNASSELLFYEYDGHWNDNGHEVVYEVFREFYTNSKATIRAAN